MTSENTESEEEPPSCSKKRQALTVTMSPYLVRLIKKTGGANGPIGRQFISRLNQKTKGYSQKEIDPLDEEKYKVAPGLIYKYRAGKDEDGNSYFGRALLLLTLSCSAYCRFCTRGRVVGQTKGLSLKEVKQALEFIKNEPGLKEVIVSGGDPLTANRELLLYTLKQLGEMQKKGKLEKIRVGTRLPINNPPGIKDYHYQALSQIKNPFLMVHINHPLELTPQALKVLENFRRKSNCLIMSQSVLLKGINNDIKTLRKLYNTLINNHIIPYYLFSCDPTPWTKPFIVDLISEAIPLWQKLRPKSSGLDILPRFVIDTTNGQGKITVPEGNAWEVDYSKGFRDFQGVLHPL